MERRFTKQEVKERGIVGLDDEEEHFFCWYPEESGANDCIGRICPYPCMNQVRVPWRSREDGNLQEMNPILLTGAVRLTAMRKRIL